jgi:ABC-type transport system involved in multi-copper enzyme maturation permease subunit
MTQTWAIFYDAYRSLNAKKMFWVVLWLSVLVAGAFACVGINERGLKLLVWQLDTKPLTTELVTPAVFYKLLFAQYGIGVWLAWLASILALVSTAGIFPDLIGSGSIHLLISKPIGRLRLFLTQYAAGLLFVALQVTLFTAACFLVIGVRGGAWEPGLFLAVPVVVCFFSYLFCVCVLLGLITRSTLAALLLTILFWLFTFGVGLTENVLLSIRAEQKYGNFPPRTVQVRGPGDRDAFGRPAGKRLPPSPSPSSPVPVAKARADHDAGPKERGGKVPRAVGRALLKAVAEPPSEGGQKGPKETTAIAGALSPAAHKRGPPPAAKPNTTDQKEDSRKLEEASAKLNLAYNITYGLKTVLPKTSETIGLLERNLYDLADLPAGMFGQPQQRQEAQREVMETIRKRTVWWVVGTSLGFEAVVLALGAWIFCRRDY